MDITTKNRTELKFFFQKNKIPTEEQFSFLLDAQLNHQEDNIAKVAGNPISLQAEGDAISTQNTLDLYARFTDTTPQWTLNLNPRSIPIEPATAVPGLNIMDGTTQDSRLFIQKANGNVGIGTVEPLDGKLQVKQVDNSSAGGLTVESSDSRKMNIFLSSSEAYIKSEDELRFDVNDGLNNMVIQTDGDVKIGTNNPAQGKLFVKQSGSTAESGITVEGSGTGSSKFIKQYLDGTNARMRTGANKLMFMTNDETHMTIDSAGTVGIGLISPSIGKLHVRQSASNSNAGIGIEGTGGSSNFLKQYFATSRANIETGDNSLILRTNGRDNVTIDRNGWVGIATTSPSMGRIHINQEIEGNDRGLAIEAPGRYLKSYLDGGKANVETGNNSMVFKTNGNDRLEIQNDGDILVAGEKPFIIQRYDLTGVSGHINKHTGYSHSTYHAGIIGYDAGDLDLDESGVLLMFLYMSKDVGDWHIRANIPSHINHENWTIDVMFINNKLVNAIGF